MQISPLPLRPHHVALFTVQNTINFLARAANKPRSIEHQTAKNLASLSHFIDPPHGTKPYLEDQKLQRTAQKKKAAALEDARFAIRALEEVMRMAEKDQGVQLGRIERRWKAWYE